MKLTTNTHEVETNITASSNTFKIKASPKAFQILTDKLYSDKVKAIIRELSCNAYDSHIAAKKGNVPFEVHLPTNLEPWFSVKDYGIGLDNDGVVNIFTTFFESTKADSNDFVGALGLGSKSPFSYVDSFSVTATKDGVTNHYNAYKGSTGAPEILLISSKKTPLPNGVEILVPVKTNDNNEFNNKAIEVLKWFEVTPIINSLNITNTITAWKKGYTESVAKLDLSDKDYDAVVPSASVTFSNTSSGKEVLALMGHIVYPVQRSLLQGIPSDIPCTIILKCKLGELDIAPSREALSYDKVTIDNLKTKINHAISTIFAKASTIQVFNTRYEAAIAYNEINNFNGMSIPSLVKARRKGIQYKFNDIKGNKTRGIQDGENTHLDTYGYSNLIVRTMPSAGSDLITKEGPIIVYDDTTIGKGKFEKMIALLKGCYPKQHVHILTRRIKNRPEKVFMHKVNKFSRNNGDYPIGKLSDLFAKHNITEASVTTPKIKRVPKLYTLPRHAGGFNYDSTLSSNAMTNPNKFTFVKIRSSYPINHLKPVGMQEMSLNWGKSIQDFSNTFLNKDVLFVPVTYEKNLTGTPSFAVTDLMAYANNLLADANFISEWVMFDKDTTLNSNLLSFKNEITDAKLKAFVHLVGSIDYPKVKEKLKLINFFSLTKPPLYDTKVLEVAPLLKSLEKYSLVEFLDANYVYKLTAAQRLKLIELLDKGF